MGKNKRSRTRDNISVDEDIFYDPRQERRDKRRNRRRSKNKVDGALASVKYGYYEDFDYLEYDDDEIQYDEY